MKFLDDHLVGGLFIGITVGLHYGASLTSYMPLFVIASVYVILRLITAK